jgi:cytochrome c biogenesis protein ResB
VKRLRESLHDEELDRLGPRLAVNIVALRLDGELSVMVWLNVSEGVVEGTWSEDERVTEKVTDVERVFVTSRESMDRLIDAVLETRGSFEGVDKIVGDSVPQVNVRDPVREGETLLLEVCEELL